MIRRIDGMAHESQGTVIAAEHQSSRGRTRAVKECLQCCDTCLYIRALFTVAPPHFRQRYPSGRADQVEVILELSWRTPWVANTASCFCNAE
jgi:hypothetical protein